MWAKVRGGAKALVKRSNGRPFATNLSLISVPIGLLAMFIGTAISAGFTHVWGNVAWPIYTWGVVLLLGGYNVATGLLSGRPARERAGLFVLSVAYAFYGVCVMVGLGSRGMVTGPVFCVLAVSCLQRARSLRQGIEPYERMD